MKHESGKPSGRLTNLVIALVVILALTWMLHIWMWDCRMQCPVNASESRFFSFLPLYILIAVGVSEAIHWGIRGKLMQLSIFSQLRKMFSIKIWTNGIKAWWANYWSVVTKPQKKKPRQDEWFR